MTFLILFSDKKHKHGNAARGGQADISFRDVRRTGSNLPSAGVLHDGNRVIIPDHGQEQDSRSGNPKYDYASLKGQFTPKSKIHIFPLTCNSIYQFR